MTAAATTLIAEVALSQFGSVHILWLSGLKLDHIIRLLMGRLRRTSRVDYQGRFHLYYRPVSTLSFHLYSLCLSFAENKTNSKTKGI